MSSVQTQQQKDELLRRAMIAQQKGAVLIRTPKPKKLGPEGLSIGKAEGCDSCKFSVPQGLSASSVKLTREEPAVSAADCNKIVEDENKVRAGTLSFNQLKEDIYRGKYYKPIEGGKCAIMWVPRGRLNYATNVDGGTTLEFWVRSPFLRALLGRFVDSTRYPNIMNNAPVYNKQTMLEFGGFSIETKLILTPSLPFNLTFQSGKMPLPIQINVERMTLFRPCPVRVDNVQYDAVLTLNDPASDPRTPCVVMIPIAAGIGDSKGDVFFRKIAEVIPGIVQPDPKTGTYATIDVQTGSTWDISKIIPGKSEGGRTIANVGYYVWSAAPRMEEVIGEVNEKFVKTTWVPTDDKGPVYIMLKDPIKVSSSTIATIQMLPATPIDKAIHDPLEGSITYSKGPPGSDVKGCGNQRSWIPKFISKETFEASEESCDPFANLPKKEDVNPGVIIGYILAVLSALALAIGIIYAIKFVVTEKGDTLMHLGKKLGKSLAGLQSAKESSTTFVNPMRQAQPKSTQRVVPKTPPASRSTVRNLGVFKSTTANQPRPYQERRAEMAKRAEEAKKISDKKREEDERREKANAEALGEIEEDRKAAEAKAEEDRKAAEKAEEERKTSARAKIDQLRIAKKKKDEEDEKMRVMKLEAEKAREQLEEETKATQALAKQLEESHKQQTKQEKKLTNTIGKIHGLERQNAAPNLIAAAAASLDKEKEELEKKKKETEEFEKKAIEIRKELETGKKQFDTKFASKLFAAQKDKTAAENAANDLTKALDQAAADDEESKKRIKEAEEVYRKATSAGTGLLPIAATPPAAHAKTIKKRQIKLEEPDEEIKDTQEAANVVDARLKSSDLPGAIKAATELVSNSKKLREDYEKNRQNIQEQHKMEGTTVTARELADARKMVLQAENIEKKAEEVKENIKSAMTEEDKEKAARNYAAAQAGVKFTEQRLIQLGKLPTLVITGQQPRKQGQGRKRRNHTRRY